MKHQRQVLLFLSVGLISSCSQSPIEIGLQDPIETTPPQTFSPTEESFNSAVQVACLSQSEGSRMQIRGLETQSNLWQVIQTWDLDTALLGSEDARIETLDWGRSFFSNFNSRPKLWVETATSADDVESLAQLRFPSLLSVGTTTETPKEGVLTAQRSRRLDVNRFPIAVLNNNSLIWSKRQADKVFLEFQDPSGAFVSLASVTGGDFQVTGVNDSTWIAFNSNTTVLGSSEKIQRNIPSPEVDGDRTNILDAKILQDGSVLLAGTTAKQIVILRFGFDGVWKELASVPRRIDLRQVSALLTSTENELRVDIAQSGSATSLSRWTTANINTPWMLQGELELPNAQSLVQAQSNWIVLKSSDGSATLIGKDNAQVFQVHSAADCHPVGGSLNE